MERVDAHVVELAELEAARAVRIAEGGRDDGEADRTVLVRPLVERLEADAAAKQQREAGPLRLFGDRVGGIADHGVRRMGGGAERHTGGDDGREKAEHENVP